MILRTYRLTTDPTDCQRYLRKFYTRLRYRGYSKQTLLPLFAAGLANRTKPPRKKKYQLNPLTDTLFLHVPFHPANLSSATIQDTYRNVFCIPRRLHRYPKLPITTLELTAVSGA
jgi:hypothetical protein